MRSAVLVGFYAAALVLGWHALTGAIGIDLYDEGYLWYGVIRTLEGEIPVRDFQAYDPGRYYWSAFWARILGPGILSLRLSNALFQILGLAAGLLAARRITTRPLPLLVIGVVLLLWMVPRHKVFEHSLVLLNLYFVTRLLERPDLARHFVSGVVLGASAMFGRNHALYALLGQLAALALVYLHRRPQQPARHLAGWVAGAALGYAPMLGLFAFAPGFAASFFASLFQFTTMARPIPWPWRMLAIPPEPSFGFLFAWVVSLLYLAMAIGYPLVLATGLRRGFGDGSRRALLYASACVGAGYAYHAFGRAEPAHLAQAVHPVLLGALALTVALPAWSAPARRRAVWGVVLAFTAIEAVNVHAASFAARFGGTVAGEPFERSVVAGDELLLPRPVAQDFASVTHVIRERVGEAEPLFIVPHRSVYYPLLGRRSPVWGIFFLRAGQGETDAEIVRRLSEQRVDWVLYTEDPLPVGQTFREIRPGVWAHLEEHFVQVRTPELTPNHLLLRRR